MQYIIPLIEDLLKKKPAEEHKKISFWATDSETLWFDLYHRWKGTPPTNVTDGDRSMIMEIGKQAELCYVKKFKDAEILISDQVHIEMQREGVKISGYIDALVKEGEEGVIVEVKSLYGPYQAKELNDGKPKSSYVKQLGIYLDAMDKKKGRLFFVDRGSGTTWEFEVFLDADKNVTCGDRRWNLTTDVYQPWAKLYNEHIVPGIEPIVEEQYKIPVKSIDWLVVSSADVTKALRGQKIIGDSWKIQYSPYKDLILKQQNVTPSYSQEELDYILSFFPRRAAKQKETQ